MSFEGLQQRLTALQETTTQLAELIQRLAVLKFQPGSVPLDTNEEGSISGELSTEIGHLLREGEEESDVLSEEVEYLRKDGHEKERLREGVERIGKELDRCRVDFRKARLAAKRNLTQAQRRERELVIQSYSISVNTTENVFEEAHTNDGINANYLVPTHHHLPRPSQKAPAATSSLSEKDRQTVGASSRATDALRQMHASLQAELERSEYANQTMRESTAAFSQLHESYTSLETMLSSSRDLLGTLMRSQKSDTWYLTTTFYMLLGVGTWLVFRRLLYGPMWWLVWLPLRTVFGVGTAVGNVAMLQGKGEMGMRDDWGRDKVSVEGLPGEDLPTAQVGWEDVESKVEEVDKVIGEVGEGVDLGPVTNEDDGMQHSSEDVVDTRPRDEL